MLPTLATVTRGRRTRVYLTFRLSGRLSFRVRIF
jgi:hypothetical protein